MPIQPRRGKVTWLRVLLLLVLIALVGGVSGLLYFGRARQKKKPPKEKIQAEKGTTLIGQDFDYTYTQGNRPVFRIRGESIRADKENTVYLDGVGLTIFDKEGRPFEIESREGTFKRATNEGELRGNVRLAGPGDLQLRTQALDVIEQGHTLVTERPAEIHYGGKYLAWGKQLTVKQVEQLLILDGKANVFTLPEIQPATSIDAGQIVYDRKQRQLKIDNDVKLVHGDDHIQADHLVAYLDSDERALRFVRALGNVRGEALAKTQAQGRTRTRFRGEDLAVLLEPAAPTAAAPGSPAQASVAGPVEVRTIALEGKPGKPDDKVELQMAAGGETRILTARRVEGKMANGALTAAEGTGGVEMRETGPKNALLRRAVGQRAQAGFRPDGQVSTLALEEDVHYKDPQIDVQGDRGQMNFDHGQGEFFGRPVKARSERGDFTGPHLTYDRSTGIIHGDNGVQALLNQEQSGALADSPLAAGEGPVHVDGKEAFLRDKPRSFLFRGDVRAWRGESVLTAAALRGDQAVGGVGEDRLTATGGVKTLYIPRPETSGSAGTDSSGKPATSQKPIEVTSTELVYLSGKGLLTYTGDVRAVQEGRTITCQQLEAAIGKDKKVDTMTCTGQAHLVDPQAGRDLQGDRAVYKVKERVIEMYGNPVHMKDKDNNRLQGKHMTYTMDAGRVEVKGDPNAPVPPASTAPGAAAPKPATPPATATPPPPANPKPPRIGFLPPGGEAVGTGGRPGGGRSAGVNLPSSPPAEVVARGEAPLLASPLLQPSPSQGGGTPLPGIRSIRSNPA